MATGMHPTFVAGGKVKASLLDNGQAIDIRPPANGLFWIGSFRKPGSPSARSAADELFSFGNFSDTLQEIGLCLNSSSPISGFDADLSPNFY